MRKLLILFMVLSLAGGTVQAQDGTHQSINDVLEQSASQEEVLLTHIPSETNVPAIIISGNMAYELKTVVNNVNDSKQDIFAENLENVYPSAIVYADQNLANGDPTLVGLDYGTVTVRVDFNTGQSSYCSGVPNSADAIQKAIFDMLRSSDYKPSVKLNHKKAYVSSVAEMAVNLGVNVSFLRAKASVNTSVTNNQSSITEVEDYTQQFYTVSITWESDKSRYFGTEVTADDEQEKINRAPLAIITSVTYGRRIYSFQDYSSSDFMFMANDTLSAFGQSAISAQNIAENSNAKKQWKWISGSDSESSAEIMSGCAIDTAIAKSLQRNDDVIQGSPLYYTVRFLGSGNTAKVVTTGKYSTVEYVPLQHIVTCTFRNNTSHFIGSKLRMRVDYNVVRYDRVSEDSDAFTMVELPRDSNAVEGFLRYAEHDVGFGDAKTFLLDFGKGEFLRGPIRLQISRRNHVLARWKTDVEGFIYPERGIIDIDVDGAIRPGGKAAYIEQKSKTQLLKY